MEHLKYLLLCIALTTTTLGCGDIPTPPAGVRHAAGTAACQGTPWIGSARLSPAEGGSTTFWEFRIPMVPGDNMAMLRTNSYFRYWNGTGWQPDCWLEDPWYESPNNPNVPRYFRQMFWIEGQYQKIWLKMYNQALMADECWVRYPNVAWSQQNCGWMTLDSYSSPIYYSTYTP